MIRAACDFVKPSARDAETVVAGVAYREALRQWPRALVPVGTLDTRPPAVSVHAPTPENRLRVLTPSGPMAPDAWKEYAATRLFVTFDLYGGFGPTVSGLIDAEPVLEELEAFDEYLRSKRWFSREGSRPGDRVMTVQGEYRGHDADFHYSTNPADLERFGHAVEFSLAARVRSMNRVIDHIVMTRVLGEEVLGLIGENPS